MCFCERDCPSRSPFASFPFASPSSAFRVGEACRRRRRRRKHFNGFGVAGNGEFNWGRVRPPGGAIRPIVPKPPSFCRVRNLLNRPITQADGVGNANELGFSLSQRVTARSEQHLSAFGIFRSFAKIDLATRRLFSVSWGRAREGRRTWPACF